MKPYLNIPIKDLAAALQVEVHVAYQAIMRDQFAPLIEAAPGWYAALKQLSADYLYGHFADPSPTLARACDALAMTIRDSIPAVEPEAEQLSLF